MIRAWLEVSAVFGLSMVTVGGMVAVGAVVVRLGELLGIFEDES